MHSDIAAESVGCELDTVGQAGPQVPQESNGGRPSALGHLPIDDRLLPERQPS
jgi:hypothetical protein